MQNETIAQAPAWAVIELMGHIRYGGMVSKDTQLGTPLLRVEVPQKDGSFVSQLVNPSSIYRLTMCSEEIARCAADQGDSKPMVIWEMKHLIEMKPTAQDESYDPFCASGKEF